MEVEIFIPENHISITQLGWRKNTAINMNNKTQLISLTRSSTVDNFFSERRP